MFRTEDGLFKIASIGGVPIVAAPSWLLQLALLTAASWSWLVRPHLLPTAPAPVAGVVALGAALGIVACIVAHELAHVAVARAYRLPVRRIVLFVFGGVSQIDREAPSARAEYQIAIAGPLVSLIIAGALATIGRALNPLFEDLPGAWGWFGWINLALAIFNLLPAFPMDGGRMLRSATWAAVSDRARATRLASLVGKGLAASMVVAGLVMTFVQPSREDMLQGLWLFLLGGFLFNAASTAGAVEGDPVAEREREEG